MSTKYKREGGGRQKRKLNDKMKKLAVYETETVSNIYATVSKFEKIRSNWLNNVAYC